MAGRGLRPGAAPSWRGELAWALALALAGAALGLAWNALSPRGIDLALALASSGR